LGELTLEAQIMRSLLIPAFLLGMAIVVGAWADDAPADTAAAKTALQKFNDLIGGWRGTGQPRRGSTAGAWQETAEFVWEFKGEAPAINYVVTDGKLVTLGRITWDAAAKSFHMILTTPDKTSRTLTGAWDDGKVVFNSTADANGEVHRITITPLNEKRTLVLYEKKKEMATAFNRVAEVGYTREGTRLATSGSGQPECIVTGGLGTMTVSYMGKTYYVCCTGCKQAFEDDPAGIIAEAAERLKKEKERKD
jgi:hypothetical protein